MKLLVIFVVGGILYVFCELFWKGRSHISMAIAGGVCTVLLYGLYLRFGLVHRLAMCLMGACVISAVEFVTGAIVNLRMGLNVWDYSDAKYNLYGQICLKYSTLWVFLCVPAFIFIDFVYNLTIVW